MSTSTYTKIENTVVSGSELRSSLSGQDVNALNFQAKLARNDTIVLTTANYELDQNVDALIQAAVDKQLINPSGMTAGRDLQLGPDSDSQAGAYISLFNLASGADQGVILEFMNIVDDPAFDINLANDGAGTNNVQVSLDNGALADTAVLCAAGAGTVGTRRIVNVYATNVTSGSRAVVFNIGPANQD